MGLRARIVEWLAGRTIAEQVALAVKQNDAAWAFFLDRAAGPSDLAFSERQEQLADALEAWRGNALARGMGALAEAWRVNALARRIVALTTDYVVGSGVTVGSSVEWVDNWIAAFWTHPK